MGAPLSAALLAFGAATASASTALVKVGSTPVITHGARVLGSLRSTNKLDLTIALRPQDPAGLQALATEVSTPGTPLFRRYLSVSRFAQQFGAAPLQIASVESALRSQRLSVGTVTANDLTIPVSGTAAQVEKAFSVSESQVKLPSGRTAYANAQAPRLQSNVARYVQGVIGLDDVTLEQPQGLADHTQTAPLDRANAATGSGVAQGIGSGPAPCPEATQVAQTQGAYTADEVAGAYGFGSYYPSDEGAGQTVALFEQEPYQTSDVTQYQSCYVGASGTVTAVNVDGGPGPYTLGTDDDGEATLDIDMVLGLAPKANILVYQGPPTATSAADILSAIVSQNLAKVISSSWGACEGLTDQSVINAENTTLEEAAAQGQSFFSSSGDSGSTQCYQTTRNRTSPPPDTSLSVIDPGGQPFATAVGGTAMGQVINGTTWNVPQDGSYPGEFVWNDGIQSTGQASGSGGGVSDQWPMPSYQSSAAPSLDVIQSNSSGSCAGQLCREVPDVSADADPNSGYVVYSNGGTPTGGWTSTGGTSAAAPLWAALTALANASATCRGVSVGFENPALYQIAGSAYQANFHDITRASPFTGQANNDTFYQYASQGIDSGGLYPVLQGYDMATGLGTPVGSALANTLCSLRATVYTVSVAYPGNQTTIVKQGIALQIHATDSGGAALGYGATGLPPGLVITPGSGLISGTPTVPGNYTVAVTAGDSFANSGGTSFTWSIVTPQPPMISGDSLGNLAKGKAKLSFKLAAGSFAPPIKSFSVSLPSGVSFAMKTKTLGKGIVLEGDSGQRAKYGLKLSHGVLTITIKSTQTELSFSIAPPATLVSGSLAAKVKDGKVKKLSVIVKVVNSSRATTRMVLELKA